MEKCEILAQKYNIDIIAIFKKKLNEGKSYEYAESYAINYVLGYAESYEKERIKIARNMKESGMDIEIISQITKLPIDTINSL